MGKSLMFEYISVPTGGAGMAFQPGGQAILLAHEAVAASTCNAISARQKVNTSIKGVSYKTSATNGVEVAKTGDTADSLNRDLIAMVSHVRSGLSSLVLGSVTAGVIAESHTPVVVYC